MWPFNRRRNNSLEVEPDQDVGGEIGVKESEYSWAPDRAGRIALTKTIDEICATDPVIQQAMRLVSRSASIFPDYNAPVGFYVQADDEKVQKVIDAFLRRTKLQDNATNILYHIYKYGEMFMEIVYKEDYSGISAVKAFQRPYWVRVNRDQFGNLLTGGTSREPGVAAYDEYIDGNEFYIGLGADRIAHFAFDQDGAYGTPVLKACIPSWKQLRAVIERVASTIAELRPLRLHKIPIPQSWDNKKTKQYILRYAAKMGGKDIPTITDTMDVSISRRPARPLDIFMPCKIVGEALIEGTIENIDSPSVENDMELIKLWRWMALSNIGVPPEYLPVETAAQRYTPEEVQLKSFVFATAVRELQYCFRSGLDRLIKIELMLNADDLGLDVMSIYEGDLFKIITPRVPFIDDLANARVKQAQAQAILMGSQAGLPMDWWLEQVMDMDSEDISELEFVLPPEAPNPPPPKPKASDNLPGESK